MSYLYNTIVLVISVSTDTEKSLIRHFVAGSRSLHGQSFSQVTKARGITLSA